MRVLVISNFYPPFHIGGYELGCRDVVDGLRVRGCDVVVLSSYYGLKRSVSDGTWRWLSADFGAHPGGGFCSLVRLIRKESANLHALRRAVRLASPDVVYFWNLGYVSASAIEVVRRASIPCCAFVSDHWLARLEETDAWCRWIHSTARRPTRRAVKGLLRGILVGALPDALPTAGGLRTQFASRFLREQALAAGRGQHDSPVIYWGVDTEVFRLGPPAARTNHRILFVGQVAPHKGVHTAVTALSLLASRHGWHDAGLDIVGGSTAAEYVAEISELARSLGVTERVRFLDTVPRSELPGVYAGHHVLVFPSVWEEPFSITILEAMASGTVVVSTPTGGSPEILCDGSNALVFPPEDAATCAQQIDRLFRDAALVNRLRASARQTVESSFRLDHMIDRIAVELRDVIARHDAREPAPGPDRRP